jgi:hypothetical protein
MVRVQGSVLYNGKPLNKRAKRQVGYVMQVRRCCCWCVICTCTASEGVFPLSCWLEAPLQTP